MDLENELRALREELARQDELYDALQFDAAAAPEPEQLYRLADETHEHLGALVERMTPVRPSPPPPAFAVPV